MRLHTQRIIVEGSDCSGKDTLIREIHKRTQFRHNIHNRSFLSMWSYADHYGKIEGNSFGTRGDSAGEHRQNFIDEILHLNNLLVVLIPPDQEIHRRVTLRGDEYQTPESAVSLNQTFRRLSETYRHWENVLILEGTDLDDNASRVISKLDDRLTDEQDLIVKMCRSCVVNSETSGDRLTMSLDVDLVNAGCLSILKDPAEGYYYSRILGELLNVIRFESRGGKNSRRFIFTDPSCISLIQVTCGSDRLDFEIVQRSCDTNHILPSDLSFYSHMAWAAADELERLQLIRTNHARINLTVTKAHYLP